MQAQTPPPRRKGEPRPVPIRNEAFEHLSVPELREYRQALTAEEGNVSYWRRIMQARLDVVVSGSASRELNTERLRPLLTSERVGSGRRALVEILPIEQAPRCRAWPSCGRGRWTRTTRQVGRHSPATCASPRVSSRPTGPPCTAGSVR